MEQQTGSAGPVGVGTAGLAHPTGPVHGATALVPVPAPATAPASGASSTTGPASGAADGPPPASPGDGAGGGPDLSGDVRAGLRWSVISQLAVRMVSVASGIVLLRLLQPDEYGVYAFALAVVN